ncbi:Rab guanine nucleotide exchange factor sec2 [Pseudocercospora fuligena]|uniref:Rab guanine nucleotide exchange factor sec2 n=1 Tax=Pseudocercospora fuligena TaxID=685502 RepID=A0A8H6RCX9_9PEZI|nr:Rab guanine nucleotide exchange factor sec2 [Pseudocercospora fuligena]
MAAVASPPPPIPAMRDDHVMDTRTPSPVQKIMSNESNGDPNYKPDLSAEVALLSTKLVNAINYQTNLDDSLQHTRHELEQARQEIATLQAEKQRTDEMVTGGVLVKKADVDKTIARLRAELSKEKSAREVAEKAKKQVEGELENLTSALFEEANSMVAAARRDTEAVEKRNAQLKAQLQDTEMLMASQQEQLQDLKGTMEKLQEQSPSMRPRDPSMPSTPITTSHTMFDALQASPNAAELDQSPEHPLHFSQLISPVLRSDIAAFNDFQDLLLLARRLGAHSRSNSSQASQAPYNAQPNTNMSSSSPNLPGSFSFANSSPTSAYNSASNIPPLKDSKFYKRVLTEDIEPTLRLDLAPGLSFLSRRTVLGALLQGTLAVEPYPQNKHYFACTLCGEGRRSEPYVRKYRFRTSEEDNVSKPICDFCVSRLRASCDFVGFLRMVRDGHWKCDSEQDQKSAWEESVRLREKMFWSRLGGGVIPCMHQSSQKTAPQTPSSAAGLKSSRQSLDSIPEGRTKDAQTSDEDEDEPLQQLEVRERPGSIATAILGMSAGAASQAMPSLQQHKSEDASGDEKDASASQQLQTELDTQAGDGAEDVEPSTPFEDASEHKELPVAPAAEPDVKDETPVATESDSTISTEPAPAKEATPRNSLQAPSLRAPRSPSPSRNSLDVEKSPTHERKNSSVLARVRAMEASN